MWSIPLVAASETGRAQTLRFDSANLTQGKPNLHFLKDGFTPSEARSIESRGVVGAIHFFNAMVVYSTALKIKSYKFDC